jgi:DNA-binding winged helix-turn-helix (wHTH) protein/Tol biopolymer transport system component
VEPLPGVRNDLAPTHRFGLFEVNLANGILTRHGTRVKLQEQPFRILSLLLKRPGEIVTREELRQALWQEGTHVNFDGSLNAALKKLRSALQDDAENPRFIETIPRQGYRFLAPIHVVSKPAELADALTQQLAATAGNANSIELRLRLNPELAPEFGTTTPWDRRRAERTQQWIDALLLAVAILFGSWLLFYIVYPVPRPSVQRMNRITYGGRIEEWGGIVSDGTRIFFLEREGNHWSLMQTSVKGGNAEKMPTPFENTRLFAISPDHSQFVIGQFTRRDEEMPLWLWPVQGGEPRRLGEAAGADPAWSPDGTQIVFVSGGRLYSVHRDGTMLHELAHVNGRARSPAWSEDGASIRFTVEAGDSEEQSSGQFAGQFIGQSIWEMFANGSGLHPVVMPNAQPPRQSAGNWTEDGRYFLFSGCEEYECNLWGIRDTWTWYRRSQHSPFPLTSGPDSLRIAVPAQTGTRVFAFSFRSQRELQRMEAPSLHATTVGIGTYAEQASVSPDGDLVAYVNRPDGSLWSSHADGSSRLRLTNPPLRGADPRWSPKGEQLLFTGARPGQSRQIYMLSSDGGALRPVIPKDWEAASADWLPDGYRIIVSMRNPRTHPEYALFFLEPTTGVLKELPDSAEFSQPRSSPDGRFVAAIDETGQRLMLYDVQKEKWSEGGSGGLLETPYWAGDSSGVYFQDALEEEESVFRRDVSTGRVERVAGFGEILRGSASHCVFNGLGRDGAIYVMLERGLTDIYSLDLDLP